jgi:hypothetical protein
LADDVSPVLRGEPEAVPLDAPPDYPFPKAGEAHVPWSKVQEQLENAHNYWLATTRPDGRPHVAPLWGIWLDNVLYFEGGANTRWARNMAINPSASINLESGSEAVIAEGTAKFFPLAAPLRDRLIAAWAEKYGRFGPQHDTDGLFRFVPRVVRAWSESLDDGARWFLGP